MSGVLRALLVLQVLLPLCAFAADEKVQVELNSIESADNRCRLNFVVENKSHVALESLKLDLVGFGTDGAILRRLITEMVPCARPRPSCGPSSWTSIAISSVRCWSTT